MSMATMRRNPKSRRIGIMHSEADYGPALVRDAKGRLVLPIGSGLEFAEIPDINRPNHGGRVGNRDGATVRVAKRADYLLLVLPEWKSARSDDSPRFLAAEQLRRETAIASGAVGEIDRLGISVSKASTGLAEVMAEAMNDVRRAMDAVRGRERNRALAEVLANVVLGNMPAAETNVYRTFDAVVGREMLLLALDRLAEHYGLLTRHRYVK